MVPLHPPWSRRQLSLLTRPFPWFPTPGQKGGGAERWGGGGCDTVWPIKAVEVLPPAGQIWELQEVFAAGSQGK